MFNYRISLLREARNINQATLADRALVSRSNLSAIENGHRDLTVSTLCRIALALGVPPSLLLVQDPVVVLPLNRHDYDAIARSVVSGKRRLSQAHNCLADEMAAVFTLKLQAYGLPGFVRVSRLKPDEGNRLLKLKIKYGQKIVERLAGRIHWSFLS